MSAVTRTHFILYVQDQEASRAFFEAVLGQSPTLHVPGMTEFTVSPTTVIGLMPERNIERLLNLAEGSAASSGLRGELYLMVLDPEECHRRALAAGARELSSLAERNWGDLAAYCVEPNGYVLAFARPVPGSPGA